jgi:pimeloyl-ACP methyl ester carboxylesterase
MATLKKTGYAPVNGIKMYYEVHGEGGLPLVLIHGGGSSIESTWANMLPLFAAHGQVIAMELQAHGRTNDRDAPESFEQDADDVAALAKHLGVTKANFFGFSNGGTTTLQIAIRYSGIVNKIVNLAGAYSRNGFFEGFFDGFEGAALDSMPAPLKDDFLRVTPDKNLLLNMFNKDVQRMKNFRDIPEEAVRAIKAPSLIMANDRDVVPVEHAAQLSRIIPAGRLAVLPGVHGECIGEVCAPKPEQKMLAMTAALVENFLKDK